MYTPYNSILIANYTENLKGLRINRSHSGRY